MFLQDFFRLFIFSCRFKMDFFVVYNIIYTKPEWCKDTSFAHLLVNKQTPLGCEETSECICYTLVEKKDEQPNLLVPLSDSVALVIKNVNLPIRIFEENVAGTDVAGRESGLPDEVKDEVLDL
jgi:hypothetical protein